MSVLFTFLNVVTKYWTRVIQTKNFFWIKYIWRGTVLGGDGMVARAEGSLSHCICYLEVEKEELWWLPHISLL